MTTDGRHSRFTGARTALVAVCLALLLQALAPPGYMAGSLDDGWPVILCPEGLPHGFVGNGHAHHEHDGADASALEGQCLYSGVLDGSLTVTVPGSLPDRSNFSAITTPYNEPILREQFRLSHFSRGPPTRA